MRAVFTALSSPREYTFIGRPCWAHAGFSLFLNCAILLLAAGILRKLRLRNVGHVSFNISDGLRNVGNACPSSRGKRTCKNKHATQERNKLTTPANQTNNQTNKHTNTQHITTHHTTTQHNTTQHNATQHNTQATRHSNNEHQQSFRDDAHTQSESGVYRSLEP
jgi:hypothetical protein